MIPLVLLRPLRLCVASEQLRSARIILLRATHIPYIAAIWVYESFSQYWLARRDRWLHETGLQKRSVLATRISFSHRVTKYPAMRNRSEASLLAKRPGSEGCTGSGRDLDVVAEVNRVMEKLGTQAEMIEKLSRQVEKLTGPHPPVPKAEADA